MLEHLAKEWFSVSIRPQCRSRSKLKKEIK
jgi:hypothetical protein